MRDYLKEKTFIRFPGGECYEILGMIGEGGSGLIYSAGKVVRQGENYVKEKGFSDRKSRTGREIHPHRVNFAPHPAVCEKTN